MQAMITEAKISPNNKGAAANPASVFRMTFIFHSIPFVALDARRQAGSLSFFR